jgi:hypothetical protein
MQNALRPGDKHYHRRKKHDRRPSGWRPYTAGNAERSDFHRSFGVVDRDGQKPDGIDAARGARGRGRWFTSGLGPRRIQC